MKQIKCPQCGKLTNWENNEFRPFCSERCRMIDFGAWIDEEYRVPDEQNSNLPQLTPEEIKILEEESL